MKKYLLSLSLFGIILTGCSSLNVTSTNTEGDEVTDKKSFYGERVEAKSPSLPAGISGMTIKWNGFIYESRSGTRVTSYPGGIVKDDLGNIVFPKKIEN